MYFFKEIKLTGRSVDGVLYIRRLPTRKGSNRSLIDYLCIADCGNEAREEYNDGWKAEPMEAGLVLVSVMRCLLEAQSAVSAWLRTRLV